MFSHSISALTRWSTSPASPVHGTAKLLSSSSPGFRTEPWSSRGNCHTGSIRGPHQLLACAWQPPNCYSAQAEAQGLTPSNANRIEMNTIQAHQVVPLTCHACAYRQPIQIALEIVWAEMGEYAGCTPAWGRSAKVLRPRALQSLLRMYRLAWV